MFGRIRASSSSSSSSERPPSKILKDDSFSIYESTLMKLKLGSRRNLNSALNEAGDIDPGDSSESMQMEANCYSPATSSQEGLEVVSSSNEEEVMAVDADCSPRIQPSSTDCHSTGNLKQHHKRTVSVLYLFSKFRNAQNAISSSSGNAIEIVKDDHDNVSPSLGSCSSRSTEQQFERDLVSSMPVGNM